MSLATRVTALATRIAEEIKNRPGQLAGTTEERNAYPRARRGLTWFDTTLGFEVEYTGSKWQAAHPIMQRLYVASASGAVRTERKTIRFTLGVPLDATRGWVGQLHSPAFPTNGGMFVYAPEAASSGAITSVGFAYTALFADFASSALFASVVGYPVVD